MVLTGMFIHHLDWKCCLEFWRMGSGAFSGKRSAESLWIWFFPAPWSGRDLTTTALARWHNWRIDIYTSGRMTYDFSGTISKTSCHLAIIEWRPQKVVERWPREGQLRKKTPVSRKTAGKTSTELGSQPRDIQIAAESVASICKLCCTPRKVERTHHSFMRFSKLSCTMQVLIFSKIIQDPFEIWKWPKLADWMWQVVHLLAQLRQAPKTGLRVEPF